MSLQTESSQGAHAETLTLQDPDTILDRLIDTDLRAAERMALIHHLVDVTSERRAEAMQLEIDHIASICPGRAIEAPRADGGRSLYFATRDTTGESSRLDDIYQLTQHPNGSASFQVDFMRNGSCGYRIVGDALGNVSTYVLIPGYMKQLARDGDGEQRFFEEYMDRSLQTARIMKRRWETDPEAAKAADDEAKEMLQAYLEAYSSELAR